MNDRTQTASSTVTPAGHSGSMAPVLCTLLLLSLILGASLALCRGTLVYSLDDAYIHLSVSEQIARGGYGINNGELSAPSSSVLWDFLLAPPAGTPLHQYLPLMFNTASLLWSVMLLRRVMLMLMPDSGAFKAAALSIWAALCLNLFGLVLTGMEHSLQVALSLAVLHGVMKAAAGRTPPAGMYFSMVLGPMIRYEMLAVTVGASVVLLLQGRRLRAVLLTVAAVAPLAGFALFLMSRGLPPLPGSVLAKLAEGGLTGGPLASVANRLKLLVSNMDALRFLLLVSALPVSALFVRDRAGRMVTAFAAVVGVGHLVMGRYGWFGRYHVYAMTILLFSIAWNVRAGLNRYLSSGRTVGRVLLLLLPLTVFLLPELATTLKTPLASRVIFLQHGVMRRIALSYGGRIAVNDIGWVSYGNPEHVLDLWGLANEESRRHHLQRGTGWVERMVEADGAGLVMLYGSVFQGEVPGHWLRVAVLRMTGPVVVGFPEVDLFVTRNGDPARVAEVLDAVTMNLPPGAIIQRAD